MKQEKSKTETQSIILVEDVLSEIEKQLLFEKSVNYTKNVLDVQDTLSFEIILKNENYSYFEEDDYVNFSSQAEKYKTFRLKENDFVNRNVISETYADELINSKRDKDSNFEYAYTTISGPFFSKNNSTAIIAIGSKSITFKEGSLSVSSSGKYLIVKKRKNKWEVIKVVGSWIS